MAAILSVSTNGTVSNPSATSTTRGLGVGKIRSIEPYAGAALAGLPTILTVIKMEKDGTKVSSDVWLSPTATATVITNANA